MLKEIAPRVTSVAVFVNPANDGAIPYLRTAQEAAPALGLKVHAVEVRAIDDFDGAFARIAEARAESLLVAPEALIVSQRKRIAEFAARQRLPVAVHGSLLPLDWGELIAHGAVGSDYGAITALCRSNPQGAWPADLPVEQPTKFKMIINMRTARALDLAVPPSLLIRADEVIQ